MGFITATRQCVAQANSWSLEELHLDVCVADESDKPSFDDCSFAVEGLKLSGAVCRKNLLFTVDLPVKEGQRIHEFHERGVAIIASTAHNYYALSTLLIFFALNLHILQLSR